MSKPSSTFRLLAFLTAKKVAQALQASYKHPVSISPGSLSSVGLGVHSRASRRIQDARQKSRQAVSTAGNHDHRTDMRIALSKLRNSKVLLLS